MKRIISLLISTGIILTMTAGCVGLSFDDMDESKHISISPSGHINFGEIGNMLEKSTSEVSESYGKGPVIQKEYNVNDFNDVVVYGGASIEYYSGDSGKIIVETQENLLPYVDVLSKNGTLKVDLSDKIWMNKSGPKITVFTPDLYSLEVYGAAQLLKSDIVKGENFTMNVSGACSGDITLDVDSFKAILAGAGSLNFHGTAASVNLNIAGAGNYNGLDLTAKNANITISGAGLGSITCIDNLDVTINGAGSFSYAGSPALRQSVYGFGRVSKVNR